MDKIRNFKLHAEYLVGKGTPPSVSYVDEGSELWYDPLIKADFEMFLYSNGRTGTKITDDIIGLCVVPSTHTEDGNARFMCLTDTTTDGSTGRTGIAWGPTDSEVLKDKVDGYKSYQRVPLCESGKSCSLSGTIANAYLPSDIFTTGTVVTGNCIPKDLELRMVSTSSTYDTQRCPYPYLENYTKNPDYFSGDVDTKFLDGWKLTRVLSGDTFYAARACAAYGSKNYGDNASSFETYLPTIGELGYMMARLKRINEVLTSLGTKAQTVATSGYYWSSSEYSSLGARYLNTSNGLLNDYGKIYTYYVRPFVRRT